MNWHKVKGLAFLAGLTLASTLIVCGVISLVYWVAKGIL